MADFNFTDERNLGKDYKGFFLVKIDDIPEEKAKGVFLRHRTTGLEVYHIIKDDKENLFSFVFRTPVENSKGIPHILEHSTLCGSERFPLKEPFTTLDNQSVKTFLNAFTSPDKTSYPAASLVKSDYFNLFDVYADAVFFPKLSLETFEQEGHRIELDENGKLSIQGVVYNEMKGVFSGFDSVVFSKIESSMYKNSQYAFDSGGDPLEIPNLTYEEFVNFHKTYYTPSNCLLFLYGDIPTSQQLDFLNEKYIQRLENKYGSFQPESGFDVESSLPYFSKKMEKAYKTEHLSESIVTEEIAPDNGENGSTVGIMWYLCSDNMVERIFLNELLIGNDSSPMSIKLKESGLGDDLANLCGNFNVNIEENLFGLGLSGVARKNKDKVYQLVMDSLKQIYDAGFEQKDIDSAVMSLDFMLHEIVRYSSPHSIALLNRVSAAWCYGKQMSKRLSPIAEFEEVKKQIAENPDYIKGLIKKYFIDNAVTNRVCITPSKKYFTQRNKKESELLKKLEKSVDKTALKKKLDKLHAYQQKVETEEELSCIPHLKISELPDDLNTPSIKVSSVNIPEPDDPQKTFDLPVLISNEETNGVVYFNVLYPIDNLEPEQFKDFPLLRSIIGELGWNGKDWKQCTAEVCSVLGDIIPMTVIGTSAQNKKSLEEIAKYPNKDIADRQWLKISAKFLTSKLDESLAIVEEMIPSMSFDDLEHFDTLVKEYKNILKTNFVGSEGSYLSLRASSDYSIPCAINELTLGITQFFHIEKYTKSKLPELLQKLKTMYFNILSQGAMIHVVADSDSLEKVLPMIPEFAKKIDAKPIKPLIIRSKDEYTSLIYKPEGYDDNCNLDVLKYNTNSGCSLMTFEASELYTKESAAEHLLANWLNGHQLWEKIRMTGGAYGGGCITNPVRKQCAMKTWRDPTPLKSLDVFAESLKEVMEITISQENMDRLIISAYGEEIDVDGPSVRGETALARYLYGRGPELKKLEINQLLSVTPEDVKKAAQRLYENMNAGCHKLICCDNSVEICGNIIKIPL